MNLNAASSHLVQQSSEYILELLNLHLPEWAVYHGIIHTRETVDACNEIGMASGLSADDVETIMLAAWFHDAGYVIQAEGHEEVSGDIAEKFFTGNNIAPNRVAAIIKCIYATKITSIPISPMEKIIKDADLISLGRTDYFEKNNLIKSEIELRTSIKYTEVEWLTRSIKFLSGHKFHTEYAKLNYSHQVEENLNILKNQLHRIS